MSQLYTAKIVSIEKITQPVNELFDINLGFQDLISDVGIGKFQKGESIDYNSCSQKIIDWANTFTPQEFELELKKLSPYYQPDLIEGIINNIPYTKIIDHNSIDGMDTVFSWFIHSALHSYNSSKFKAVNALRLKIDIVSIHPDAWFARHDDRWEVRKMALRLLAEVGTDLIEKNAIYKLFGKDFYEIDFNHKGDGAYLVVPQCKLSNYIQLEFTQAFKDKYKDAWWISDFEVKDIFKSKKPSDNAPYAYTQFDIVTFPFWLPNTTKKVFESRAYPS